MKYLTLLTAIVLLIFSCETSGDKNTTKSLSQQVTSHNDNILPSWNDGATKSAIIACVLCHIS